MGESEHYDPLGPRIHMEVIHLYIPTWMVDFYGFHVGKYASLMDGMGMGA